MKFTYPELLEVFDTDIEFVNCIIIENQELLYRILVDIYNQLDKNEGKSVLSESETILSISQNLELLTEFIQFDVNKKSLVNRLTAKMIEDAIEEEQYEKTITLLNDVEKFLYDITFSYTGDVCFEKCNIDSLIKAVSPRFDYSSADSVCEKIIDYVELVKEYDKDKLFITYNLRDVVSDSEVENFMEEILKKEYNFIMIETKEHNLSCFEKRYIVDKVLCEIK